MMQLNACFPIFWYTCRLFSLNSDRKSLIFSLASDCLFRTSEGVEVWFPFADQIIPPLVLQDIQKLCCLNPVTLHVLRPHQAESSAFLFLLSDGCFQEAIAVIFLSGLQNPFFTRFLHLNNHRFIPIVAI